MFVLRNTRLGTLLETPTRVLVLLGLLLLALLLLLLGQLDQLQFLLQLLLQGALGLGRRCSAKRWHVNWKNTTLRDSSSQVGCLTRLTWRHGRLLALKEAVNKEALVRDAILGVTAQQAQQQIPQIR